MRIHNWHPHPIDINHKDCPNDIKEFAKYIPVIDFLIKNDLLVYLYVNDLNHGDNLENFINYNKHIINYNKHIIYTLTYDSRPLINMRNEGNHGKAIIDLDYLLLGLELLELDFNIKLDKLNPNKIIKSLNSLMNMRLFL